jgi:hypothetical protein
MKKNVCYVLAVAVLLVLSAGPLYGTENTGSRARFQLFNAEYNSALIQTSKTTVFTEKKLFKIDTQTGETWMLIDVFKDGQDIKYWKKINEGTGS